MELRPAGVAALREAARRRPVALVDAGQTAADAAAFLRSWYYPKQAAFCQSPAKWRATSKTRRSGATAGGCREFLARALELPGFRSTYVTTTRGEAHDRAWMNDTKSGLVDVLMQIGEPIKHPTLEAYRMGGVTIEVRTGDLTLEFSNGSQIELFGADNIRRHRVKRGNAKHAFWIDEAQDFPWLEEFIDKVALGSLTDTDGEIWLSGTPGQDCAGMYYEITKELDKDDPRLPGWEVHTIASTDNPFFGAVVQADEDFWVQDNLGVRTGPFDDREQAEKAAVSVRWDRTAGKAMRDKNWKGDEPDFVREWLGKWVKTDARYVYPIHGVPDHVLLFAPQRLCDNPLVGTNERFDGHPRWYDHHAAVADLPRPRRSHGTTYQWLYGLWVDFGYNPDPLAIVLGAFTPDLPDIYEMFSWKCTRVNTDDQATYLKLLWDAVTPIVSFVGDPAGKQDDFDVWRSRMNLPIEEAKKKGKNTLEEFLANDVRRGRVHLRKDSPLHLEMRHLVYLPGKPGKPREVYKNRKVNGVIHGDHNCDAMRYGYADLTHYLAKLPQDKPAPGSREAYAADAERAERSVETAESKLMDRMEEHDDMAGYYREENAYEY